MSRFSPPPIIRASERLLLDVENAVRRFPRYHRYQIGADLRRQAMTVYRRANRAWRDRAKQSAWVDALVWDIDDLKQHLQTGKLLQAFVSFAQFEALARQAEGLGAQAGGWRRQLMHPSAQSVQAGNGVAQRGEKLSTRSASAPAGAYP